MLVLMSIVPRLRAESASVDDQKIAGWQSDIEHASEKGDYSAVQNVRMRLADYAAVIGRNDLAVRQYELILASRPGRADRVRYSIRLGKAGRQERPLIFFLYSWSFPSKSLLELRRPDRRRSSSHKLRSSYPRPVLSLRARHVRLECDGEYC